MLLISVVILGISSGIVWMFFDGRWENDRLVNKLAEILDAEIYEPHSEGHGD
ncbi:MAG: hypothetical protein AAGM33_11335 [Pseudomonadota bacterium]